MSSEVDICNLALSHLGDVAEVIAITPPDGTAQASHCARFYPIARDQLLELFPWTFATKRVALAEVANPADGDWAYAYALPSTCIRPVSVVTASGVQSFEAIDPGAHPYLVETNADGEPILLTNVQATTLRYIDRVTDTTKFTPAFVSTLARLLASMLAGPILKGEAGMVAQEAHRQAFEKELEHAAKSSSGNRGIRRPVSADNETVSSVTIANLALAYLSQPADLVALTDNSIQAAQCRHFYPVARDTVLEMHPWTFAVKRADLVAATNPADGDWAYAYALPATCMRPLSVVSTGGGVQSFDNADPGAHPYLVETADDGSAILLTNLAATTLRYIDRVTDAAKFTPGFVTAVARLLASMIAPTLINGEAGLKAQADHREAFERDFAAAAKQNAQVSNRGLRRPGADSETTSSVTISNMALAHLGETADIVALTDNTVQAAQCRHFYPIARDQLLEAHPWTFAVQRVELTEAAENPNSDDWAFAYTLPADCLRPLAVLAPGMPAKSFGEDSDAGTYPYVVEAVDGTPTLFTNVETATLRYIAQVTDLTKYPPAVMAALARLLASMVAGPLIKGEAGLKVAALQREIYAAEFGKAAARDSNRGRRDGERYQPSFIAARGFRSWPPSGYVQQ